MQARVVAVEIIEGFIDELKEKSRGGGEKEEYINRQARWRSSFKSSRNKWINKFENDWELKLKCR